MRAELNQIVCSYSHHLTFPTTPTRTTEAKVALKAREVEQAAARLQTHKAFAAAVGALRREYEGKVQAAQEEHAARMAVRCLCH